MPVTMTITMQDNGQLNVNGPIHDKVVSMGLLALAMQVVFQHKASAIEVPRLVAPDLGPKAN